MTQKNLFPVETVNAREVLASEIENSAYLPFYNAAIREKVKKKPEIVEALRDSHIYLDEVENMVIRDSNDRLLMNEALNQIAIKKAEIEKALEKEKAFLYGLHNDFCKHEREIKEAFETGEELGKVKLSNWDTQEKQRIDRVNAAKIAAARETQKQEQKQLEEQAEKAESAVEKAALLKEAQMVQAPLPTLEEQTIKTEKAIEVKSKSKLIALLALRVCFSLSEQEKSELLNYIDEKEIKNLILAFSVLKELRIPEEFPIIKLSCIKINEAALKEDLTQGGIVPGNYIYGQKVDESNPEESKEREVVIEKQLTESWLEVWEKAKNVRLKRKSL